MRNIMTGAVFTNDPREYPKSLAELNKKDYPIKVSEVYGSLRTDRISLRSARPDFRLRDVDSKYLKEYVAECNRNGIVFNYTANSLEWGDLEQVSNNMYKIVDDLKWLESIGVGRITVASTLIMSIVCEYTRLPIEVSTIMNIHQPTAIRELKQQYPNIDKICLSIDINRNLNHITRLISIGEQVGIKIECLVTEFCKIGHANCSHLHRQTCYRMHSHNMSEETAKNGEGLPRTVKGYPWNGTGGCIYSRSSKDTSWLLSNTVWPNDIIDYMNFTCLEHIKISTRTAPPDFALWLTERYMAGEYNGNLAGLWLPLQLSSDYANDRHGFVEKRLNLVKNVPYSCEDLSTERLVKYHFRGKDLELYGSFFSLFLEHPNVDWSQVDWETECDWYKHW